MRDVRPPVAVEACGTCAVTHPEGWGYTEEAGRHRSTEPSDEQRAERRRIIEHEFADAIVPFYGKRVGEAMELISRFGGTEGEHHKAWVIDQVARILLGSDFEYDKWAREVEGDPEDEDIYCGPWDEGIAP